MCNILSDYLNSCNGMDEIAETKEKGETTLHTLPWAWA